MSDWAWVLIAISLCILVGVLVVALNYHEFFDKNKAVEKQIKLGNTIWCFYTGQNAKTREDLICGYKYRSFNDLVQTRSFLEKLGKRKIFVYETTQTINGIECAITFYANVYRNELEKPRFIVEPEGEKLFNENA